MKKLLLILPVLLSLGLSGCDFGGAQIVQHNNYIVISPPADLFNCPVVRVPNVKGLTNQAIARYVVAQYNANVTCRNNMKAIQKYVIAAQSIYHN